MRTADASQWLLRELHQIRRRYTGCKRQEDDVEPPSPPRYKNIKVCRVLGLSRLLASTQNALGSVGWTLAGLVTLEPRRRVYVLRSPATVSGFPSEAALSLCFQCEIYLISSASPVA